MSLEDALKANTAALEANTAALKGKPAAAGSSAGAAKSSYTAKHTKEEMQAVLGQVKEKFGMPDAKTIVKEVGKADKMAEITDAKLIDEVFDAATKKLEEGDGM